MTQRIARIKQAQALLQRLSSGEPSTSGEHRRLSLRLHALALEAGDPLLQARSQLQRARLREPLRHPAETRHALQEAERVFETHGLVCEAAACRVGAARAICDDGRERAAIHTARSALRLPGLSRDDQAYAHVLIALCHGRIGEFDAAFQVLKRDALPMAQLAQDPMMPAKARWALGMTSLQSMLHALPQLRLSVLADQHVAMPPPGLETVRAQFDEARAALPAGRSWAYIDMARQLCQGLSDRAPHAAQKLVTLAARHSSDDPMLAAWCLCCSAVVLIRHADDRGALAALARSMALADLVHATGLKRHIWMLQARAHEQLGEQDEALGATKRFADLQILSVLAVTNPRDPALFDVSEATPRPDVGLVETALRCIEERLVGDLSVGDLARHCGVSRRSLEVAFKRTLAVTVAAYVKRRRLERSAELLQRTNRTIRALSLDSGYKSAAAFSRDFKARYGQRPSEWRKVRPAQASFEG